MVTLAFWPNPQRCYCAVTEVLLGSQEEYALAESQKSSVRDKWALFKEDPFHPSLRTHKIHRLSAVAAHTIYSVVIEGDLRVLFRIDSEIITTLDVGTPGLYR